jgi:transcriptional regulator with XRE-family HTH domain
MTSNGQVDPGRSVTELTVHRMKTIRKRRGLSAPQLAARCAQLGAPEISGNVVANIESRRRQVNLDQLAVLALALDVSPTHLLGSETNATVQVTSAVRVDAETWQAWLHARAPLPQANEATFWAYCLEHPQDADASHALIEMARQQSTRTTHRIVAEMQEQSEARATQIRTLAQRALDMIEEATTGNTQDVLDAIALARQLLTPQE